MIKRFAGVNIFSDNPEELTHFYQKLGIPVLTEHPDKDNYDGVELGFDGRKSIIWIWNKAKWGRKDDGVIELTFNCDDLDRTYEDLRRCGIPCAAPSVAAWGGREIRFCDLDGNRIIIME